MIILTLRMDGQDAKLIKEYIAIQGISLSEFAGQVMLERIEDEFDLKMLTAAMEEDHGIRFSHVEVMKELGIG